MLQQDLLAYMHCLCTAYVPHALLSDSSDLSQTSITVYSIPSVTAISLLKLSLPFSILFQRFKIVMVSFHSNISPHMSPYPLKLILIQTICFLLGFGFDV